MTYRTLRLLSRHTRMVRRLGYDIKAVLPGEGWHAIYDVRIAGRRFTLWSKESSPGASTSLYALTIDGRVRFLDRSSIFSNALEGWEAITGIRYLGFYEDGSPVYGHREDVEVMPSELPFLNYSKAIRRMENPPARSYPKTHDPFALAD